MIQIHLDFLGIELTALGSDEHHAVGTLVAIECGGSSILQYGYALHFLGRDILDITLDTIYHEERGVAIQTLHTADVEGRIDAGIVAGILQRNQAGTQSQDRVADILGAALVGTLAGDDRHC